MPDIMENLAGAVIQHGPESNRVYLMKLGNADPDELIPALYNLASGRKYTKIFAKLPGRFSGPFMQAGYKMEAKVPHFYGGEDDACFMGLYLDPARSLPADADELEKTLQLALRKQNSGLQRTLPDGASIRSCTEDDVGQMAVIYKKVFPSYPFPIHDSAYLLETMRSHVAYFGVEVDGSLRALSSSEMDADGANTEMTDFATLPESLGQGFAAFLLAAMEPDSAARGIKTAYTIARAVSPGMNITFARLGYEFGGRLINNTQISGSIESMNVWYKPLS
ncbi:MAG: putative beta-lysine N-acetyltransferase [Kiritimatiellia bacterium]